MRPSADELYGALVELQESAAAYVRGLEEENRAMERVLASWGELLAEHDGNVGRVAKKLGVRSARLRKFVAMSPRLCGAIDEVFEGAVDEAVAVLFEGLRDQNSYQNRFYAAKEFLRSGAARRRGFGHEASGQATLELKDKAGGRTITLRWLEPREEIDPVSDDAAD